MQRPELTFKAGETEVRWTYGLQLDLQRLVPDAESMIESIMTDTFTKDYIVRRALTPLKKSITEPKDLVSVEDVDLDPDQILDLIDWVSAHLLHFFINSAKNLAARGAEFKANLPSTPSTDGSAA